MSYPRTEAELPSWLHPPERRRMALLLRLADWLEHRAEYFEARGGTVTMTWREVADVRWAVHELAGPRSPLRGAPRP